MRESLQGAPVEVVVGSGDDTGSWWIPAALLTTRSGYLRAALSSSFKEAGSTFNQITLMNRSPAIFQIFVQWLYFDTIPDRFGLSRLSTGGTLSNGFLLWTLGDYLEADTFQNRIMRELFNLHSLHGYVDELRFVEFTAAEVEYCWSNTLPGSKLRQFILAMLSQHLLYGDYIRISDNNDWSKIFHKHSDLQLQVISTIATSRNTYSPGVAQIADVGTYLKHGKVEQVNSSGDSGVNFDRCMDNYGSEGSVTL